MFGNNGARAELHTSYLLFLFTPELNLRRMKKEPLKNVANLIKNPVLLQCVDDANYSVHVQ